MALDLRKTLYWEGSSKKDFKGFPVPVQKELGVALFVVQLGGFPPKAKPWKGLGSGVYELVLHAFQKKSASGIATPRPDVTLIEGRLRAVTARYGPGRSE